MARQAHGACKRIGVRTSPRSRWRPEPVRFVHGTRFGNNEYNNEYTVLAVLLYRKDWENLRKEMATGIDSKEKQVRRSQSINPVKFPATQ